MIDKLDWIIIGGQKCGTTSLYNFIVQHPDAAEAYVKEPFYFSREYEKTDIKDFLSRFNKKDGQIMGEASTDYFHMPEVPIRIKKHFPDIKLILLVRNPIDRAWSHFVHNKKVKNREPLRFMEALQNEEDRIHKDFDSYIHYTYKERGKYNIHLKNWYEHFNKNQLLILKSEDLFSLTHEVTQIVYSFLGLSSYSPIYKNYSLKNHRRNIWNLLSYKPKKYLKDFFQPHMQEFKTMTNLSWPDFY